MAQKFNLDRRPGEPLGRYIRRVRRDRDDPQTVLQEILGETQPGVSRIERGLSYPRPEAIRGLARYLGIPVAELRDSVELQRLTDRKSELERQLDDVRGNIASFTKFG